MTVQLDGPTLRSATVNPQVIRHFDHGYAVTSHSSQGLTAGRVLINVEVSAHRDLINQRFAYLAVSRGTHDVQLYTENAEGLAKDLSRDISKSSALELSHPTAEQVLDQNIGEPKTNHKEPAEGIQPSDRVPPSIYAASLQREAILNDIGWSQEQAKSGADSSDATRGLVDRHLERGEIGPDHLSVIARYADRVIELAYTGPDVAPAQQISQLRSTADERGHWEPLVKSIGIEHAEPFAWRKEHGEIQSYRSEEPRGWLHIDGHGQFVDCNAQPIAAQIALEPFGLAAFISRGNEQSATMNKENPADSGYAISL